MSKARVRSHPRRFYVDMLDWLTYTTQVRRSDPQCESRPASDGAQLTLCALPPTARRTGWAGSPTPPLCGSHQALRPAAPPVVRYSVCTRACCARGHAGRVAAAACGLGAGALLSATSLLLTGLRTCCQHGPCSDLGRLVQQAHKCHCCRTATMRASSWSTFGTSCLGSPPSTTRLRSAICSTANHPAAPETTHDTTLVTSTTPAAHDRQSRLIGQAGSNATRRTALRHTPVQAGLSAGRPDVQNQDNRRAVQPRMSFRGRQPESRGSAVREGRAFWLCTSGIEEWPRGEREREVSVLSRDLSGSGVSPF